MTYRILSVSGGGIRGILPATLAAYLEKVNGKPCSQLFDAFVGTSTGSILCAGLVHPNGFAAHDIVNLYLDKAATIFPASCSFMNLFDTKYDGTGLTSVLADIFGTATLGQALKPYACVSVDLADCRPHIFGSTATPRLSFADACRSSSAGETFFPANHSFVDGGNCANDPSVVAICEALKAGVKLEDIRLFSLGCGRYEESLVGLAASGELSWAAHVSQVTIDSTAELAAMQAQRLLGPRYLRIQPNLTKAQAPMDNVDPTNMAGLQALAAQVYSDNQKALEIFFAP